MSKFRLTRRTISLMLAASLALGGFNEEAAALMRIRGGGAGTGGSGSSPLTQAAFTIKNFSTTSQTPGMIRIGLPFKSGDVPAGNILTLFNGSTQITAQFDQQAYYGANDPHPGSLMFCVCTIRDDSNGGLFNASESRTYTPHVGSGSWDNTGTRSLSDITNNHQFQVQLTNVGYINQTWNPQTSFHATISGTVMNVTNVGGAGSTPTGLPGVIQVGSTVTGTGVTTCTITSLGTGTGGVGTYNISVSQSVPSSTAMLSTVQIPLNTFIVGGNASGVNINSGKHTIQQATTSGVSQNSQPTWNTTLGGTTTDGSVTWTNVNASANTNTYNGGTLTIDFNSILTATTSGQATRLTKIHSGAVCETWMAWGMANNSGTPDTHLKGYVYVTIWKNSSGGIADFEFGATVSQDWWGQTGAPYNANRYMLTYNASLVDVTTSTTYLTYNNICHPYNSQWFTGSAAGNNNDGRRFWVNQMPTLSYLPNQLYWVTTAPVPPLNAGAVTGGNTITFGTNPYIAHATYVPCVNINVNAFIDQTGGSNGRGVFMDSDCIAFFSQNPADVRAARISAFSGMHVPYHSRSDAQRTRTQDGGVADIGSCPMPLNLGVSSFPTFSQMPSPVDAYRGVGTTTNSGGYTIPLGGANGQCGVWDISIAASHASTYTYFMYLLEGERHMLECCMDLAENTAQQVNASGLAGVTTLPFYGLANYKAAFSIPSTVWHGIPAVYVVGNTRSTGWAMTLLGIAAGIVPAKDAQGNITPEEAWFNSLLAIATQYNATSVNTPYMPSSELTSGWWIDSGDGGTTQSIASAWMQDICLMGTCFAYGMTSDTNAQTMMNFHAKQVMGRVNNAPYRTAPEKTMVMTASGSNWTSGVHEFLAPGSTWLDIGNTNVSVAGSNGPNITITGAGQIFNPVNTIAVNDVIYWSNKPEGISGSAPVPNEVTIGTPYYIASVTPSGANVVVTISGSPTLSPVINFANSSSGSQWFGFCAAMNTTPAVASIFLPQNDSYPTIARAALAAAKKVGISGASASLATMQSFLVNTDATLTGDTASQYFGWFMA